MRLSTGIIISILSTNVFAIEHPNGAHPGSLLARRAVVADADGPFLQKRNNDKDQKKPEEQKKQKKQKDQKKWIKSKKYHSFDYNQDKYVHRKGGFGEDSNPNPNYNDDTQESNTDFHTYDSNQDRGATGGREDVHTDDDLDQEGSSFADAPKDSPPRVFTWIRDELSRIKHGFGLFARLERAGSTFKQVWDHFDSKGGHIVGWHTYRMLEYALKKSQEYKLLYKNSAESPFILKLPSSASDEQRKTYKSLQDEVQKSIKDHISDIMHAVESILTRPGSVVLELENIISSAEKFYLSISDMRSEYSGLLSSLGMSGSKHIANLDHHMTILEAYKCNLYGRLNVIKEFIKAHSIKPPNQERSTKSSSSALESNRLSKIGSKPSEDAASSSTQSNDVASSDVQSDVAVAYDLVIL